MRQLTQKLGSGEMKIIDVPLPQLSKGTVLVKNYYSLISAGTESSTVSAARKNLIAKAKDRPQQVKQVVDTLKNLGPQATYRAVMKKLDSYSPLGYSCVGEIIDISPEINSFKVGDFVACAGISFANHAEVVCVPINLCVKLKSSNNLPSSAFNTLGAIALQGIRQANLNLGETAAVIGLGLLGQLTCAQLKASGVKVIGIDINDDAIRISKENNVVDLAINRNHEGINDMIFNFSEGIGVDSVIITAGSKSLDPINFAGQIARKKGNVVVTGVIPTGFERDPYWYKKELELRMSCSYGPGRYDNNYEIKGIDYPAPYVRWTENRNMLAFQDMIERGVIDINYLITHRFKLDEAADAYDLILNKREAYLGVLIEYDAKKNHKREIYNVSNRVVNSDIGISFIGAGSYAQSNLLPNISNIKNINRIGVLTNSGTTSRRVAEKFKFNYCTDNLDDLLNDKNCNTIFITTRHDSHYDFVIKCLKSNKNIFVEKPLCLNINQLDNICKTYKNSKSTIFVGYNRRFSPFAKIIKSKFDSKNLIINYRINAGYIGGESWLQDKDIGGGRIIGEVCHFIDFISFLNDSNVQSVSAINLDTPENNLDNLIVNLKYENGSIANISYLANGPKSLKKEYIEVYGNGVSAIIDDFKSINIYSNKKKFKKTLFNQDKGQKNMVGEFIKSLQKSEINSDFLNFHSIINTSKTTFSIQESILKNGERIIIR